MNMLYFCIQPVGTKADLPGAQGAFPMPVWLSVQSFDESLT
jgi:hypothetical protein